MMLVLTAAAGCSPGHIQGVSSAEPPAVSSALSLAHRTAREFMDDMVDGAFQAQWQLLSELAKAQWPSESARASMLERKFSGSAKLASFTLGRARSGALWTSGESPDDAISGGYSISIAISFDDSIGLLPVGVAQDYQALALVIAPSRLGGPDILPIGDGLLPSQAGPMKVFGEGPASMDAPIIEPPHPPDQTASVPILMYHLVGPFPLPGDYVHQYSYRLDYNLTVPPAQFASEMNYLAGHDYTSISLARLTDFLIYDLPLPAHPVVLTLDDGFANEFQYALPQLQRENLTATFFPCSGLIGVKIGQEQYMSAPDLADLTASGFWVEDHSYNDGTVLWGQSPSEIRFLTAQSARTLAGITGEPIQFIAYSGLWPYPSPETVGPGETQLFGELARLGYVGGLEENWLGRFPWRESSADIWELPRVRAYPGESIGVFAQLLNYG
jgi:peptidoglycan/xylan/chitin deacetylase (PgdA/CDA1 family)